jgi:beta-phosphoglucomutase family hydrolase
VSTVAARCSAADVGLPAVVAACLFDLDGVLTNTASLHATAWKRMFDEFLRARDGAAFAAFDVDADYLTFVDGKERNDGVRSFLRSRGIELADDSVAALADRKNRLALDLLRRRGVDTYSGSVEYVRAARAAGLRCAVVSSSANCSDVLEAAGIEDLFDARVDAIVAAERRLAGKPAPDTFLAAAAELDVDPAAAAVFEDSLAGVEAGRAGRFAYVVGIDRVGNRAPLLASGADLVVADLAELLVDVVSS